MESATFKHVHSWREVTRDPQSAGDGGYVACECGDEQFLTEHDLSEFRRQRTLGMEPIIDEEGVLSAERET